MKRAFLVLLVIAGVTGTLVWWLLARQKADPSYQPGVARRTWTTGSPRVLIDDGHWNEYTAVRGYAPFARLLFSEGYFVVDKGNGAMKEVLDTVDVVVIANALGLRGVIRQVGLVANIRLDAIAADAFTDQEVEQLETWVREGGSLLLVADHAPAGRATRSVADRFGVTMRDGYVFDPERSEPYSPAFLIFTRQSKTLAYHAITEGPSRGEAVNRVVTFSGQALEGPRHATQLLTLSHTAFESSGAAANLEDRKPVGGLAQALAFVHGRGRVVVVGDAAVLTSQLMSGGGVTQRIGLQWPNSDNERFARNIMRWLSHASE